MKRSSRTEHDSKGIHLQRIPRAQTPIAIIQGYAEGLQLGVAQEPEQAAEYCGIIMEETLAYEPNGDGAAGALPL